MSEVRWWGVIKDIHHRQKLRTDFSQTCCNDQSGCGYYNSVKKNYTYHVFPGGSNFKGLDNKIIGFAHIQKIRTTDFFYNLKSTKVLTQALDLPNKKGNSPPCCPEPEMFKLRNNEPTFYCLCSKHSCEILTALQLSNRGNDLGPIKNVTILMNGKYHRNDLLLQ